MFLEIILTLAIISMFMFASMRKPKNFPPGPTPLPFLGNYPQMDLRIPTEYNRYIYLKYGPLCGFLVPRYKIVIVNGWESIKEMMLNDDFQGRPDTVLARDRFDGGNYGLLFTDGEVWKTQKRFTLHTFRNFGFGKTSHENLIMDEVQDLIKEIITFNGKPFSLESLFYLVNINITWTLLSSRRYSHDDPEMIHLAQSIKDLIHDIKIFGSIASVFPFLRYFFPVTTGYKSIKNGGKVIRQFAKRAITEHKKSRVSDAPRDFLDAYLQRIENESSNDETFYTEDELVGICLDLLLAGSDTSTGHLSFAILFLCLRSDIQDKIYDEIMNNIGPDRLVCLDDKPKMVYTEAFLMEISRFRTVVPSYPPHRAVRDSTLGGFNIPKGTLLFADANSVFLDEVYWEDPDNFRPERFISEEGLLRKEERLIPFGKGKRSCVGETQAKMSSFLIITSLIQNLKFRLPDGEETPSTEPVPGFTVAPVPFEVIATPRIVSKHQNDRERSY